MTFVGRCVRTVRAFEGFLAQMFEDVRFDDAVVVCSVVTQMTHEPVLVIVRPLHELTSPTVLDERINVVGSKLTTMRTSVLAH